jgi:hypothetical protein
MEYMMEWVVIYRNFTEMAALAPSALGPDDFKIQSDLTGVNLYFEARRSDRE